MKMSSDPSTEDPTMSDSYSYENSVDYNLRFTEDISKHMQMPDRLAAVDGFRRMNFHADLSESFMKESAAFAMTMPEKIVLGNLSCLRNTTLATYTCVWIVEVFLS